MFGALSAASSSVKIAIVTAIAVVLLGMAGTIWYLKHSNDTLTAANAVLVTQNDTLTKTVKLQQSSAAITDTTLTRREQELTLARAESAKLAADRNADIQSLTKQLEAARKRLGVTVVGKTGTTPYYPGPGSGATPIASETEVGVLIDAISRRQVEYAWESYCKAVPAAVWCQPKKEPEQ